jgi:hypothetical protein
VSCIQRLILDAILSKVPLHEACHGHRSGRSVRSFVGPHVGKQAVIRLDLAEFFSSIQRARVRGLFASLGYPSRVALRLAAFCCASTPRDILRALPVPIEATTPELHARFIQQKTLASPHLPQGAPSSPVLANLIAYRLDARLSGLARAYGAVYTRYADDLAFSGASSFADSAWKFIAIVAGIARDKGFQVRFEKTRIMTAARRQLLCGVVINETPSLPSNASTGVEGRETRPASVERSEETAP